MVTDRRRSSLIRLSHVDRAAAPTADGRERSDAVPLLGTPHGRALAEQQVQVLTEDGSSRLFAPVTSRGERSASWSWRSMARRMSGRSRASLSPRTRWPTS